MEYISVGEVIKPQGVLGEIKLKPLTEDLTRFKKLKLVYIDEFAYKIIGCREDGAFAYLRLAGIDDRDKAERLRGKLINIDRIHAKELDEGEYFISDLLKCEIYDEKEVYIGKLVDVSQYGAADVFTVREEGGKVFRFPFLKKLVFRADVEHKSLLLYRDALDGVTVYED